MKVLGFFSLPVLLIGYLGDFADAQQDPPPYDPPYDPPPYDPPPPPYTTFDSPPPYTDRPVDLPPQPVNFAYFEPYFPFNDRSARVLDDFLIYQPDTHPARAEAVAQKYDVDPQEAHELARLAAFARPNSYPAGLFSFRERERKPQANDLFQFLAQQGPAFLQQRQRQQRQQGPQFDFHDFSKKELLKQLDHFKLKHLEQLFHEYQLFEEQQLQQQQPFVD